MTQRWLAVVGLLAGLLVGPGPCLAQATGVNPTPGSIWTYLGPTYGAAWQAPPQLSYGWVASDAVLAATVTAFQQVYRAGYYAPGDGGGAFYTHSASACSLNGGVGDNGSQVKAVDGGCWLADLANVSPTPLIWGAKGDGTTNDTVPVQAAINAMVNQTLFLGPKRYCVGALVVNSPIAIQGDTPTNEFASVPPRPGLRACALNLQVLTFNSGAIGSILSNTFIDANPSDTWADPMNTGGAGIVINNANNMTIDTVGVDRACLGVDLQQGSGILLNKVKVTNSPNTHLPAGCGGIRVGHGSTGGNTSDVNIVHTIVNIKADYSMRIEDAGGMYLNRNDLVYADRGTIIQPGANQTVTYLFADSTVLSDTTCYDGLTIDTAASTGAVSGLHFNQTWTSSAGSTGTCAGSGVNIENTGGGSVAAIHFVGHRSYGNGGEGIGIAAGSSGTLKQITVDNSLICDNNTLAIATPATINHGIVVGANVAEVAIRNNSITGYCMGSWAGQGFQNAGIVLGGGNSAILITGNDLRGNVAAGLVAVSAPTGDNMIKNNLTDYAAFPNVATAATITAPIYESFVLTGTVTVNTINGMWNQREASAYIRDGTVIFTGGNLCNSHTAAIGETVLLTQIRGYNCINVK